MVLFCKDTVGYSVSKATHLAYEYTLPVKSLAILQFTYCVQGNVDRGSDIIAKHLTSIFLPCGLRQVKEMRGMQGKSK